MCIVADRQHMLQLDVRIFLVHLDRDLAPHTAGVEDVGFIDAQELLAP